MPNYLLVRMSLKSTESQVGGKWKGVMTVEKLCRMSCKLKGQTSIQIFQANTIYEQYGAEQTNKS